MRRRLVLAVGLSAVAFVLVAEPAAADHQVVWGAGGSCETASRSAQTVVDRPVPFIACVVLGGEPLPGHALEIRVQGPTRSATGEVVTADDGVAEFVVQPTAAGDTTVTLCDADGCLYGTTVITATPAATTTTAPPPTTAVAPPTTAAASPTTTATTSPPTTTASTAPPSSTTTTARPTTTSSTPAEADDDEVAIAAEPVADVDGGGGTGPMVLVAVLVLLVLLGGGLAIANRRRARLHTDYLHVSSWKLEIESRSETVWWEPFFGPDGYILRIRQRPVLWVLIEKLRNGRRVGVKLVSVTPDQEATDAEGEAPGIVDHVSWEHSAQKQHHWPGREARLEDPRDTLVRVPQPTSPLEVAHYVHRFDTLCELKDDVVLGGARRPEEACTYRVLQCVVQLLPVEGDGEDVRSFDRRLGEETLQAMATNALNAAAAAAASATGPLEPLTTALIGVLTEEWGRRAGTPLFVSLGDRVVGEARTSDLPISSDPHSADDAPFGSPPELWARGEAVDADSLDAPSGSPLHPDPNITVTIRSQVRLLVRRDGDEEEDDGAAQDM